MDDHSTETAGRVKKVEALGALKLLSGGSAPAPGTGRNLNLVTARRLNAMIGGNVQERIEGMCTSITTGS